MRLAQPSGAGPCAQNPYYPGIVVNRGFGRTDVDEPLLPVFPHRAVRAWPNEGAPRVDYLPLQVLLTRQFSTDAHFAGYTAPHQPYRLLHGAYQQMNEPPRMAVLVFDIDCPSAHETGRSASDEWFAAELEKVGVLQGAHPGGFVYRTRGGYRIVYQVVPAEHAICSEATELGWRFQYARSAVYLARSFGIVIDGTCKAWNWIFRAPHATRDPAAGPEARETFGGPMTAGYWHAPF
jgi:hypothetical protein